MARYIDADKFAERIRLSPAFKKMAFEGDLLQRVVLDILGNAPTADVVEVCRCHECKYGDNGIQKQEVYTVCNRFGNGILKMSPLDFCSYGERRGVIHNG